MRYFMTVNETGSIRRAAEFLHLSPAALSKAIKQLEVEVGFTLLVPAGRGIVVTDQGKDLVRAARPFLEGLDSLAKSLRHRTKTGFAPIRLGSFEVFTTHFLNIFLESYPKEQELHIRDLIPGDLERSLLAREVDYGITYIPVPTAEINHQKVASVEMGIFGADSFRNEKLSEIPFVVPIRPMNGAPNKVQGLDGWPDHELPRNVRYQVTLLESALELCRKGKAVGYFPKFLIKIHNEIVKPTYQLTALHKPRGLRLQKQPVYLVTRKSDPQDVVYRKVAKIIRLACNT